MKKLYAYSLHFICRFNYIVLDNNLFILPLTFVQLPKGWSCARFKLTPWPSCMWKGTFHITSTFGVSHACMNVWLTSQPHSISFLPMWQKDSHNNSNICVSYSCMTLPLIPWPTNDKSLCYLQLIRKWLVFFCFFLQSIPKPS